jgi:hypothetical protein
MPSREEIWKKLVQEAGDDAVASAASVGVEQAERELAAAKFDVKAERARANALIAELVGESGPTSDRGESTAWVSKAAPESERKRPAGTRRAVGIALALAALATLGGVLYALATREKPHETPIEVPRQGPPPSAPVAPGPAPQRQETPTPAPRRTPEKPTL